MTDEKKTQERNDEELTFNEWSRKRISQGKKICTSRTRVWNDNDVYLILRLPLKIVRDYLFSEEGADSPEEFEKVWRGIFRGKFEENRTVFVHFFGNNKARKHKTRAIRNDDVGLCI